MSAVARQAGIHPSQLYGWDGSARAQPAATFAAVRVCGGMPASGTIEVEFANGFESRIFSTFGLAERRPSLAHAVMASLICWPFRNSMFRYLLVDHVVPAMGST